MAEPRFVAWRNSITSKITPSNYEINELEEKNAESSNLDSEK
jgi:hypothetical protein